MRGPAPDPHPDQDLLQELEPVAELLNRHVSLATEWLPHQYVSWRLGQASTPSLDPEQPRPSGVAQAASQANADLGAGRPSVLLLGAGLPILGLLGTALASSRRLVGSGWPTVTSLATSASRRVEYRAGPPHPLKGRLGIQPLAAISTPLACSISQRCSRAACNWPASRPLTSAVTAALSRLATSRHGPAEPRPRLGPNPAAGRRACPGCRSPHRPTPPLQQIADSAKQLFAADRTWLMLVDAEGQLRWASASDQTPRRSRTGRSAWPRGRVRWRSASGCRPPSGTSSWSRTGKSSPRSWWARGSARP